MCQEGGGDLKGNRSKALKNLASRMKRGVGSGEHLTKNGKASSVAGGNIWYSQRKCA